MKNCNSSKFDIVIQLNNIMPSFGSVSTFHALLSCLAFIFSCLHFLYQNTNNGLENLDIMIKYSWPIDIVVWPMHESFIPPPLKKIVTDLPHITDAKQQQPTGNAKLNTPENISSRRNFLNNKYLLRFQNGQRKQREASF